MGASWRPSASGLGPRPAAGWMLEGLNWLVEHPSLWPLVPVVFVGVEFHLALQAQQAAMLELALRLRELTAVVQMLDRACQ